MNFWYFLKSGSVELLSLINFDCYYYYFLLLNFLRPTNSSIHDLSNNFFYPTPQLSSLIPPSSLGEDFFFFFLRLLQRLKTKTNALRYHQPKAPTKMFFPPWGGCKCARNFLNWMVFSFTACSHWTDWMPLSLLVYNKIKCLYLFL